jgi:uncharacterized phiE125 gp8 family phage protein
VRLELVTAADVEPITLAEAKAHLRLGSSTSEDALVVGLIQAAREHVEAHTRRRLVTQHWRLYFDSFGRYGYRAGAGYPDDCGLVLGDVAPVSAIDSVKYLDTAGVLQTLSSTVYQLVPSSPARLVLAYSQAWPDIRGDREGVRVEVTCGYGLAAKVPASIKQAVLLIVGHLFENRENSSAIALQELPLGVAALLSPHVVPEF